MGSGCEAGNSFSFFHQSYRMIRPGQIKRSACVVRFVDRLALQRGQVEIAPACGRLDGRVDAGQRLQSHIGRHVNGLAAVVAAEGGDLVHRVRVVPAVGCAEG